MGIAPNKYYIHHHVHYWWEHGYYMNYEDFGHEDFINGYECNLKAAVPCVLESRYNDGEYGVWVELGYEHDYTPVPIKQKKKQEVEEKEEDPPEKNKPPVNYKENKTSYDRILATKVKLDLLIMLRKLNPDIPIKRYVLNSQTHYELVERLTYYCVKAGHLNNFDIGLTSNEYYALKNYGDDGLLSLSWFIVKGY